VLLVLLVLLLLHLLLLLLRLGLGFLTTLPRHGLVMLCKTKTRQLMKQQEEQAILSMAKRLWG